MQHQRTNTRLASWGRRGAALVAAVAALAVGISGGDAVASNITFGAAKGTPVTVRDMAMMENPSGTFSDKYTVEAFFEGGGEFYFSVLHSSFGVGSPTFEVKSTYTATDGTPVRTREELKRGEWSQTVGAEIQLAMGRHALRGKPRSWTVVAEGDNSRVELTFTPSTPPWRPGSGRASFGGSDFLDMTVLAARANVTGTVRVGDTVREVKGHGYALHTYASLAPHEMSKRAVAFRSTSGKVSVYFREVTPPDGRGSAPIRWLLVAERGKVVFESTEFAMEPGEFWTDAAHENRYRVPQFIRIAAKDGERTLEVAMKAGRRIERSDRLEGLSAVERAVAARFAKPVFYAYHAQFQIRLTEGEAVQEWKGRGVYEMDHLNP